jgi:hypothetical protein
MGFFDWFKNSDDFERGTLHEMMPKYQFKLPRLRNVKDNITKSIEGKWVGTSFQDHYYYNEKTNLPYNPSIDYVSKFNEVLGADYRSIDAIESIKQTPFFDNKIFKFRKEIVTKKYTIEINEIEAGLFEFLMGNISKEIFIRTYFWHYEKGHEFFEKANLFCETKEIQEQTNRFLIGTEEPTSNFLLTKEDDFYILKDGYELGLDGLKLKENSPTFTPFDSGGNVMLKTLKNNTEAAIQQLSDDKLVMHSARDTNFILDSGGIISENVKWVISMCATELSRVREKATTQINVEGDYVDDRDTIVKDSVISRSNVGPGVKSKAEQIKEIKDLLDAGAIDDDEFKQMKKEILTK